MPIEVISVVIAFVGACIAFAGMLGNARKDSDRAAGRMSEVIAKLDFIGDDIKEMKADYRNVSTELKEVRDIAVRAKASADSAHKRLDSAGIDQHGARF
jgi:outer membrane murein-binding lipoprotein Lpp